MERAHHPNLFFAKPAPAIEGPGLGHQIAVFVPMEQPEGMSELVSDNRVALTNESYDVGVTQEHGRCELIVSVQQ